MTISKNKLIEEKSKLEKDFDEMSKNIKKIELEVYQMKANLNAINGAIQQTNKFIELSDTDKVKK